MRTPKPTREEQAMIAERMAEAHDRRVQLGSLGTAPYHRRLAVYWRGKAEKLRQEDTMSYEKRGTSALDTGCTLGRDRCGYAQADDECLADKAGPCREAEPTFDARGLIVLEPWLCAECGQPIVLKHFDKLHDGWNWIVRYRECNEACRLNGSLLFGTRNRAEKPIAAANDRGKCGPPPG